MEGAGGPGSEWDWDNCTIDTFEPQTWRHRQRRRNTRAVSPVVLITRSKSGEDLLPTTTQRRRLAPTPRPLSDHVFLATPHKLSWRHTSPLDYSTTSYKKIRRALDLQTPDSTRNATMSPQLDVPSLPDLTQAMLLTLDYRPVTPESEAGLSDDDSLDPEPKKRAQIRFKGNGLPPYRCLNTSCAMSFANIPSFREHIGNLHASDWALCKYPDCTMHVENTQYTKASLSRHYTSHHGRNQLYCHEQQTCTYVTHKKDNFAKHIEKCKLYCPICFISAASKKHPFPSQEFLEAHIERYHLLAISQDFANKFQCTAVNFDGTTCDRVFDTIQTLGRHKSTVHAATHVCIFCPPSNNPADVYNSETALARHVKEAHPKELNTEWETKAGATTFSCNQCSKVFNRSNNLKRHISSSHGGDKPFRCNAEDLQGSQRMVDDDGLTPLDWDFAESGCDAAYSTKASLTDHVRQVHFGLQRWDKVRDAKVATALGKVPSKVAWAEKRVKKVMPLSADLLTGTLGHDENDDESSEYEEKDGEGERVNTKVVNCF